MVEPLQRLLVTNYQFATDDTDTGDGHLGLDREETLAASGGKVRGKSLGSGIDNNAGQGSSTEGSGGISCADIDRSITVKSATCDTDTDAEDGGKIRLNCWEKAVGSRVFIG